MGVHKLPVTSVIGVVMVVCPTAFAEPLRDEPAPKKLEWRHERFRTSEYVVTGVLLSGLIASRFLGPKEDSVGTWKGPVLMDGGVANVMRASTPESRERAAQISDYFLYGMVALPFLDAAYAATIRKSPDVAWQMTLINTQAFALTGLLTFGIKTLTSRERPWTASCNPSDPSCKSDDSFLSGHASMAFTSAGLTCAHHQALHLYDNTAADVGACVVAVAAATTTGSLRILADRHYASDVFAGALIGMASGYVLPRLLHYWNGDSSSGDSVKHKEKKSFAWSAMPTATRSGAGVSFTGVF